MVLRRPIPLFVATLLLASTPAGAHGDDQQVIEALTEELAKGPDADLLIRRGELYRHLSKWQHAEADFAAAAQLDPNLHALDFFRARLLLEASAPDRALNFIARYVAHVPDEPEGRFLEGEIHAALDQPAAGAASFAEGIRRSPRPRPEHFIRRAQLLAAAAPQRLHAALEALDEGIARLGPVISLLESTIDLELARENLAGALTRITTAMEHTPRREAWLVRQGDLLVKSARPREAIAAYRAALAAIDELPDRYRATVPVEKLVRDAHASLERLASAGANDE